MESPFSIGAQIGILVLCVFVGLIVSSFVGSVVIQTLNLPLNSQHHTVFLISVFISQLLGFIGGFILFLKITKQSFQDLVHFSIPSIKTTLIIVAVLLACIPIINILGYYNSFLTDLIPNNYFVLQEIENDLYVSEFFSATSTSNLILKLFVFAFIPALGEELIFRGVLLTKIKEASNNEHYAVIVSGVLFAAIHMQPTKLLPMVFLGIVLGYVYTRTKNIVYPILFHFLFNSITIVSIYYFPEITV